MKHLKRLGHAILALVVAGAVSRGAVGQNAVPLLITYQGEVRSPTTGEPVPDGSYDMVLRIYDVESGGRRLWQGTHSTANGNPVEVKGAIFSAILGSGTGNALDPSIFNGADRWLEIQVGAETLSPRQRIATAAYSIVSENSRLLGGKEAGQFANAAHTHLGSDIASGTVSEQHIDPAITRDAELAAHTANPSAHHRKTTSFTELTDVAADGQIPASIARDSEVMPMVLAGDGTGSTLDADLLDGMDSTDLASATHLHWATDIAFGTLDPERFTAYQDLFLEGYLDNNSDTDLLLQGQGDGRYWRLSGNVATNPAGNFLGTADNQALEVRVNNARALRIEPNATSPNVIGGHGANSALAGVVGAAIGGGGQAGLANRVTDNQGTIGGGANNQAGDNAGATNTAEYATVGGGKENTASGGYSTVGGGSNNAATANYATIGGGGTSNPADPNTGNHVSDDYGTVGGGGNNLAGNNDGSTSNATYATVGGGQSNMATGFFAAIGGGQTNIASGSWSAIPGGLHNAAIGSQSFAAGTRAYANGMGSFCWGDSNAYDIHAWGDNQFVARATGGFYLITKVDEATGYPIEGMILWAGTSSWDPIGTTTASQPSQDQADRIKELEAESTRLKERIDELESRLLALEALIQSRGGDQK